MINVLNIKKLAKQNQDFRKVVFTGQHSQLVLMSLEPGDEIGEEVHPTTDQMFFVEDGHCELRIDGRSTPLDEHDVGFAPAGTLHNLVNVGKKRVRLFTVYAPPVHAADTVQKSAPKPVAKV